MVPTERFYGKGGDILRRGGSRAMRTGSEGEELKKRGKGHNEPKSTFSSIEAP